MLGVPRDIVCKQVGSGVNYGVLQVQDEGICFVIVFKEVGCRTGSKRAQKDGVFIDKILLMVQVYSIKCKQLVESSVYAYIAYSEQMLFNLAKFYLSTSFIYLTIIIKYLLAKSSDLLSERRIRSEKTTHFFYKKLFGLIKIFL